jgi:hypothetical protein
MAFRESVQYRSFGRYPEVRSVEREQTPNAVLERRRDDVRSRLELVLESGDE